MRAMKRMDPSGTVLKTHRLGGQSSHASIVLALKHPKDDVFLDWITCELIQQGEDHDPNMELVLNLCCPRCILTEGRPTGESQIKIHQSNRMFYFTRRPPKWNKTGHIWVNPKDPNEVVTLAGTIDMPEWASCGGLGCQWRFTIEDSVVHTR
jgi:hypothetical protein